MLGWLPPSARGPSLMDAHASFRVCEPELHEWLRRLNAFAAAEVRAWSYAQQSYEARLSEEAGEDAGRAWALEGGYSGRPGENLLMYGMGWYPDGSRNPTLIYRDWMHEPATPPPPAPAQPGFVHSPAPPPAQAGLQPREPQSEVVAYLARAGVRRVVTGHKPHGDAPLVLRAAVACTPSAEKMSTVTVLALDTSYSGRTATVGARASGPQTPRGQAVCELLIQAVEQRRPPQAVPTDGNAAVTIDSDVKQTPPGADSTRGFACGPRWEALVHGVTVSEMRGNLQVH